MKNHSIGISRLTMRKFVAGCFVVLLVIGATAAQNTVTVTSLTPASPATLSNGQIVSIAFKYTTNTDSGVSIGIYPFTSGSPSPNTFVVPSQIYWGEGTDTHQFTISSGNLVVDSLRVQMWNRFLGTLLYETYIPVKYTFSTIVRSQRAARLVGTCQFCLSTTSGGLIRYTVPSAGQTVLRIYSVTGRCVATLVNRAVASGEDQIRWSGPEDVYLVRLRTSGSSITTKMLITR
jgi:hypothetical protein